MATQNLGGVMMGLPGLEDMMAQLGAGSFSPQLIALMKGMGSPSMPPPQGPSVQGPSMQGPPAGGKIQQLLGNPQLLQTIAMGLMAALGGKNKGYMMQGMQQTMQQQAEVQRQLQESQRQEQLRREQLDIQRQGVRVDAYNAQTQRKRWEAEDVASAAERTQTAADRQSAAEARKATQSLDVRQFIQKEINRIPENDPAEADKRTRIAYNAAQAIGLKKDDPKDAQAVQSLVDYALNAQRDVIKPPASSDMETYVTDYVEAHGTPNMKPADKAKLRTVAAEKWRTTSSAAGGQAAAEDELIAINKRVQAGTATPADLKNKKAIEDAKTLVSRSYGSGMYPLSLPDGRVLFIQKASGDLQGTPEGTRPLITGTERAQLAQFDDLLTMSDMLFELADKNRDSIGPAEGRIANANRYMFGDRPEVNDMFRMADNMADMLLRARSGAQINPQEYLRLRSLVPDPRWSEGKFFSDLASFKAEVERTLARRAGTKQLIQNIPSPSMQQVLGTGSAPQQSPAVSTGPKVGDTRTYQGATYKFDGKQWVRQ